MNICPCCKRAIPAPKTQDKRLAQDIAKVEAAILACDRACTKPFFSSTINCMGEPTADRAMLEAISSERKRLARALTDHKLLWSMYRRSDKKEPYYTVETRETVAA